MMQWGVCLGLANDTNQEGLDGIPLQIALQNQALESPNQWVTNP
jgi:hypothetical protein